MAFLSNAFEFTGPVDNLSFYRMHGTDKIVVRKKGGASKEKIKTAPEFARTRENNAEFSGCANTVRSIRHALFPLNKLANYNFTPTLTTLAKNIQLLDKVNERGKRAVNFSQYRYLLEGFQLNKDVIFDSVVKYPLKGMIERETGSATIEIPHLHPQLNLEIPWKAPLYRFVIGFGLFTDSSFNGTGYTDKTILPRANTVYTDWLPVQQAFESQTFTLQLNSLHGIDDTKSMILSIGIEMGTPITNAFIQPIKYAACAKILAVG
ncbi:hypothetical protein GFS24_02225 [Chitinophaga sp. SYP-B3965]|uniref:hypothetical protein n=1 Tax=Chitinophaga sp. SYP-B3965 TaxID=2663120 RepID=UPI001299E8E9|nr:hypothetical protein [Chitinophaga sp. SYP-B3965]MRG43909.1 hypothetical protein [Chitinophaga sp. SYP-B3965]